ncbi:uncharacterized protein LOC103862131 [Brassica rapa]|uniref:uncharacterized protein LOC103862131 n=1 Tax=Brassica campestris TaxID=3711 RepID=UPI0004F167DA|nr:uncharacterized protein LOC103862131 [Brassica rapa]XP_013689034.1 uncharacterized protein LOC106392799 [Brassica napus]
MISLRICVEFCAIKEKFSLTLSDLLPKTCGARRLTRRSFLLQSLVMEDSLQLSLKSMKLVDDEEPLTLPDSPRFRVFDENLTSLLGMLLNPDCQPMAKMIDYMPTAWRVYGRVRGIALSRDRHIPTKFFTTDTMFKLASEVGKVEKIAYDPKFSLTKDYIRALITFDTEKPAKATRKLTVKKDGTTVTIEFEYERIHKRCFHFLCITHEKVRCPLLRRGATRQDPNISAPMSRVQDIEERVESSHRNPPMEGPPGFPPLFPELPPQEQKAAMLYISHADATERQARIMRVRQAISDQDQTHVATLTKFTANLEKGFVGSQELAVTTGFQIGLSSTTPSSGDSITPKQQRRRPPSWKRKAQAGKGASPSNRISKSSAPQLESSGKRKTDAISMSPSKKLSTPTTNSVASSLKPLLPQ